MNIVYIGRFHPKHYREITTEMFILKALLQDGDDVFTLDTDDMVSVAKTASRAKSDMVLFNRFYSRPYGPINLIPIQKMSIPKVWWSFDWMMMPKRVPLMHNMVRYVDAWFSSMGNAISYKNFTNTKVYTLRQGVDNDYHKAVDVKDKKYDVSFFGHIYSWERKKWLASIEKACGRKVSVFSNCFGDNLAKTIAQSKIVIGDSYPGVTHGYWSNRLYVMLGYRAFYVPTYVKDMEKDFVDKKHLVYAKNAVDMGNIIKEYLHKPEDRKQIAENGYALVHSKHRFIDRVRELKKVMGFTL